MRSLIQRAAYTRALGLLLFLSSPSLIAQSPYVLTFQGGAIPKSEPLQSAYGYSFEGLIVSRLEVTITPLKYETNGGFSASVSYDIDIEPYVYATGPDGVRQRVELDRDYSGAWYVAVDAAFNGNKISSEILTNNAHVGLIIPPKPSKMENTADRLMDHWTFGEVCDRLSFGGERFYRYISAADAGLQTFLSNWANEKRTETQAASKATSQQTGQTGSGGSSSSGTAGSNRQSGSGTSGNQSAHDRAQALNDRAIAQYNSGDLNGALATIDEALAVSPGNQTLLSNRTLIVNEINKEKKLQTKIETVNRATEVVTQIATDVLATPGGQFGLYADTPDAGNFGFGITWGIADMMHLNMGTNLETIPFVFSMDMFFSDLFINGSDFKAGIYPSIGFGMATISEDPTGEESPEDFAAARLGLGAIFGDSSFYMKVGMLWNVYEISKSGDFATPSAGLYFGIGIGN